MWNIDTQNTIILDTKNNPHKHTDFICAMATTVITNTQGHTCEYLFATGYDAKISLWEISHDNQTNPLISPQLKFILFTINNNNNSNMNINNNNINIDDYLPPVQTSSVGREILALCFYRSEAGSSTPHQLISGGNQSVIYLHRFSQDNKIQGNNLLPFHTLEGHSDSINCL